MNEVKDACNTTFEEYIVKVNKILDSFGRKKDTFCDGLSCDAS